MSTVALELQPCCGSRSGIGTYTYELARRVRDRDGMHFCGTLFDPPGRNRTQGALEGITMPVATCRLFPYGVYRRIWHGLPVPYERLFDTGAELTVFFNYIVPPRMTGKVITTVHDLTYLRYPKTMDRRNLRRLQRDMAYSVARSDRIVTVSEFSKREIMELLSVPEERIAVIPCAPRFTPDRADEGILRKRLGLQGPYLLYVGTLEPRKNLTGLIRAFGELKRNHHIPHQLVLAGGRGWGGREIEQEAAPYAERGEILFPGYLTEGEKNTLYRGAAAFVFPSLYEGFGIPPLEAMNLDCPVVCSRAASLPEVVGEAARLTDPADPHAMAEDIYAVLTEESLRADLIRRGREQVQRFSWDRSARMLEELCRQVLDR